MDRPESAKIKAPPSPPSRAKEASESSHNKCQIVLIVFVVLSLTASIISIIILGLKIQSEKKEMYKSYTFCTTFLPENKKSSNLVKNAASEITRPYTLPLSRGRVGRSGKQLYDGPTDRQTARQTDRHGKFWDRVFATNKAKNKANTYG